MDTDEIRALQKEIIWLLKEMTRTPLLQIFHSLTECCRRFNIRSNASEANMVRPEKFVLTCSSSDLVKCLICLMADTICEADIVIKSLLHGGHSTHKTTVQPDKPLRLHQIQDAGNYIQEAYLRLDTYLNTHRESDYTIGISPEVQRMHLLKLLSSLLLSLRHARSSLCQPRRHTIEQLRVMATDKNILRPPLPADIVLSFYVHGSRLTLVVYELHPTSDGSSMEIKHRHLYECCVPWINDVIILLGSAIETCESLREKMVTFEQYNLPSEFPKDLIRPTRIFKATRTAVSQAKTLTHVETLPSLSGTEKT